MNCPFDRTWVIGLSLMGGFFVSLAVAEPVDERRVPATRRMGKLPPRSTSRGAPSPSASNSRRELGKSPARAPRAFADDGPQAGDSAMRVTPTPRPSSRLDGQGSSRPMFSTRPELVSPTSDARPTLIRPTSRRPPTDPRGAARDRSVMIRDAARGPDRFVTRAPTSAVVRTTPIGTARVSRGDAFDRALDRNPDFLSTAVRRGLLDATFDQTARLRTWNHQYRNPCRFPPFDVGFYRSCYRPRYRYCDPFYGYSFVSVYHDPWWWRDRDVVYVNTYPESTEVVAVAPTPARSGSAVYPPTSAPPGSGGGTVNPYADTEEPTDIAGDEVDDGGADREPYDPLFETERREWIEAGTAAFSSGRYDEASRSYAQAMLADERDGFVKCLYAASKFAAGDYGLAAVALRRALLTSEILVTTPPDVRAFYGDVAAFDAHLAALEAIVRERPAQGDAGFLLAYWNYSIGRPDRAASVLREVVNADGRDELAGSLLVAVQRAKSTLRP